MVEEVTVDFNVRVLFPDNWKNIFKFESNFWHYRRSLAVSVGCW